MQALRAHTPSFGALVKQGLSGLATCSWNDQVVPVKVLSSQEEVVHLTQEAKEALAKQRLNENEPVKTLLEVHKISDHTPIVRLDTTEKCADISYNILWKCRYDGKSTPNNGFLMHESTVDEAITRQMRAVGIIQSLCACLQDCGYKVRSIRLQEALRPKDFSDKEPSWEPYVDYVKTLEAAFKKTHNLFVGAHTATDLHPNTPRKDLADCEVVTFVNNELPALALPLPTDCVRLKPTNCQIVKVGNTLLVNAHLSDDKFNRKRPIGTRDADTAEDLQKIIALADKTIERIQLMGDLNKVEAEVAAGLDAACSDQLESIVRHEISSLTSNLSKQGILVRFNPVPGSCYNAYERQSQSPDWFIEIGTKGG